MYKTICYFEDLQDFNHPYHEGDTFPRDGMKVSDTRLKELSSHKNRRGKPLIKMIEEAKTEEKRTSYKKTEIQRMANAELKEIAKMQGIENVEYMTGGELKKILIEKFGL